MTLKEAYKEVMTDHDVTATPDKLKEIFHLMMQEYILSVDAARKLGKKIREDDDKETYEFKGFVKDEHSSISFDEDELYYVVLPLLEDLRIESDIKTDRHYVRIELAIPKDLADTPVVNCGEINKALDIHLDV